MVTIWAIFVTRPCQDFIYCLNYPGFGCLHCAGRSLCDIQETMQSRWLLCFRIALVLGLFFDLCTATLSQTNELVHIFALIWSFPVDLPFSRAALRLVDYLQYLHVIGQTALDVLGNNKILASTCSVWTAHMATLNIVLVAKANLQHLSLGGLSSITVTKKMYMYTKHEYKFVDVSTKILWLF